MFEGEPLWFPTDELLTSVLYAEIDVVTQLLAAHPDLSDLFDTHDATVPQRNTCFALLAHRKIISTILDTFTGRQEQPTLNNAQSDTLRHSYNLVGDDAPAWAREMQRVIDQLPARIYASLPEPLRRGGYNPDDAEQMQTIESAKKTLGSVEQIQTLTERVIDQQLKRLAPRWSATIVVQIPEPQAPEPQIPKHKKRKVRRTRDKLRTRRDKLIAEIDDISPTIVEFLKLMDERRIPHQPTWSGWPGSWREAYKDPRLRKLIHQDKSRALGRVRNKRNR